MTQSNWNLRLSSLAGPGTSRPATSKSYRRWMRSAGPCSLFLGLRKLFGSISRASDFISVGMELFRTVVRSTSAGSTQIITEDVCVKENEFRDAGKIPVEYLRSDYLSLFFEHRIYASVLP